jgi:uncharacterized protein (TIGR03437 family)
VRHSRNGIREGGLEPGSCGIGSPAPGDPVTIYATGVGPVSFAQGYAVTQFPVNVFIEGFYCDGISATMGTVQGFPGSVYGISVHVPNFSAGVTLPVLAGVMMQIDGVSSQLGIAISVSP